MTTLESVRVPMTAVLRNIEFKGSTMGSNAEFIDMVKFVDSNKLKPIVEHVFNGLEKADEAFLLMRNGAQFGKIVVRVAFPLSNL